MVKKKILKTPKMVFVINNYTPEDVEMVKACSAVAIVAGLEVGDKGTPHIQGAVIWPSPMSYRAAQKKLCASGKCATIKMAKGAKWSHQSYCKKDGQVIRDDPYDDGPGQGCRTDIIELRDAVKRKATDAELCDEHPVGTAKYLRFIGFCRSAYNEADPPATLPFGSKADMGLWLWGPTNVGKTTHMLKVHAGMYEKNMETPTNARWWDGYVNQDVVYIDDPPAKVAPALWDYLKRWVQEKPFRAQGETGGPQRLIRFKKLIVIANVSPRVYFGPVFVKSIFESRFKTIHRVEKFYCEGTYHSEFCECKE